MNFTGPQSPPGIWDGDASSPARRIKIAPVPKHPDPIDMQIPIRGAFVSAESGKKRQISLELSRANLQKVCLTARRITTIHDIAQHPLFTLPNLKGW
jgi:hypothetical protein